MAKKSTLVGNVNGTFDIGEEKIVLVRDEEIADGISEAALEILTTNGQIREVADSEMEAQT